MVLAIGMNSGSSFDGIDVALIDVDLAPDGSDTTAVRDRSWTGVILGDRSGTQFCGGTKVRSVFLEVDLGTGSVKTVLLDEDGSYRSGPRRSYSLHTPRPGWAEADPAEWWAALVSSVAGLDADGPVKGMAICGQMHGLALVDGLVSRYGLRSCGRTLGRAHTWTTTGACRRAFAGGWPILS